MSRIVAVAPVFPEYVYTQAEITRELAPLITTTAAHRTVIERLHTAGLAVLLVEQYLDLALRLADRFLILDAGHVVRSGVSDELSGEEVHRLLAV